MEMELNKSDLIALVHRQLTNMFGSSGDIESHLDNALQRVSKCFKITNNKYYRNEKKVWFSPYHSGQYSIFLYYLANTIFRANGDYKLATKLYYLNKIMNCVDWYYEIELPEYFGVEHPMGSVLGRAEYSDGFYLFQGCTVGGNKGPKPKYPKMGKNVILYSNATVLGDVRIGDNVVISTGTIIINENIPNSCFVFGRSPNLIIKKKEPSDMKKHMSDFWML